MRLRFSEVDFVFIGVFFLISSFLLDNAVFFFIDLIKNQVLDIFMGWVTNFFSLFVILIFMTSLFLWEERKSRWIKPLWLSFFSTILIVFIINMIVMRPRPFGNILIIPFLNIIYYSFPSTHAAVAFSALPVLDLEFPKLKWFWLGFALLIALSRIYLGFHYFSDVVAGAFFGYLIGKLYSLREKGKR